MLVRYWMTEDVVTVPPDTPITEAERIMHERGFRRLPVVKGKRLVGLVTLADIRGAKPSPATSLSVWEINYLVSRITVGEVMTRDVITIGPDAPIEEAARIMRERKVGALPVVEGQELRGIITESDLLGAFMEVLGIGEGGVRITFELDDRPGALAEALEPIKGKNVNIVSVCTCRSPREGKRQVVLRLRAEEAGDIVAELEKRGAAVSDVQVERG